MPPIRTQSIHAPRKASHPSSRPPPPPPHPLHPPVARPAGAKQHAFSRPTTTTTTTTTSRPPGHSNPSRVGVPLPGSAFRTASTKPAAQPSPRPQKPPAAAAAAGPRRQQQLSGLTASRRPPPLAVKTTTGGPPRTPINHPAAPTAAQAHGLGPGPAPPQSLSHLTAAAGAANNNNRDKFEKKISATVEFTKTLLNHLGSTPQPPPPSLSSSLSSSDLLPAAAAAAAADDNLVKEIMGHIEKLNFLCQSKQQQSYQHGNGNVGGGVGGESVVKEIDEYGTKLWNLCTSLRRGVVAAATANDSILSGGGCDGGGGGGSDVEGQQKQQENLDRGAAGRQKKLRKLYLFGRALGFWLVGIARCGTGGGRGRGRGSCGDLAGVIKLGLKVVRGCIEEKETKLAAMVLQLVADYKGVLQDLQSAAPSEGLTEDEVREAHCLETEILILRTALAWLDNRLDVAEHMYAKTGQLRQFLTRDYAEKLADVLYEIGKSLYAKGDYAIAVKWLDRANDIINGQELEQLSREGIELRLAVLQALVSAHLSTETEEGLLKAKNSVDFLEGEMGNKLIVSLLKLEVLQKTPGEVFDGESYAEVLRHIIRNFTFSDSQFRLIMHHIRKLHDKSPGLSGAILDDFIIVLRGPERSQWMEKAVITRVWMITNQRESVETIGSIQDTFRHLNKPLSAEAAVAAQALLWKTIESNYSQGQHDLAESWCQLALHHVFQNCGPLNTAKLERKLLLCALARNNMDGALSVLHNMSESSWKEPMTAYLAFKVATRTEDRVLAEKCLETISKTPDHVEFLGACIAESQKAGDVTCALAALKILQEKYEHKEPNPIHLPALFRCTIRLLNIRATQPDNEGNYVVIELCEAFENVVIALEHQKKSNMTKTLFTVDELEWFSRNAYNLALKNTTAWELEFIVRMLLTCVNIISHFPPDVGNRQDLTLKSLFSRFVVASALLSLARTHDNVDKQLEGYAIMREQILAFDSELPELLPQLDEHSRNDMLRKHAALLTFDFEAAVALQRWDDLGGIVQRAVPCKSITAFQAMADCLLRARAPGQALYSTMRKLVNEIWVLESFDALKLAKYTRCLFQATLPLDDGLAMRLLDEACVKARELREGEAHWPEEELEWMAATAFNHAIDCFSAQETERSKEWATRAINLAGYCDDGRLEEVLRSKYSRLGIDEDMMMAG